MTILSIVYASAPVDEVIIHTLEIAPDGADSIYICEGFEDITVTLEDESEAEFIGSGLDISRPSKDGSGQQDLSFAIDNVMGEAQKIIESALDTGAEIKVIMRIYLASDLSVPAEPPLVMTVAGATFQDTVTQIQASYYDILNTTWPRRRYTLDFAPGLKYI